jgi:hypothetical protein
MTINDAKGHRIPLTERDEEIIAKAESAFN